LNRTIVDELLETCSSLNIELISTPTQLAGCPQVTSITQPKKTKTAPLAKRSVGDDGLSGSLHVGYQVARLARLIARDATRRLSEEVGLTLAEWRILLLMGDTSGSQLDALAELALLEKSHASIAAAALVRLKLVRRTASPGDGRRLLLSRTAQGSRVVARYLDSTAHERRALWGVLSPAEQASFGGYLTRLLEAAEREPVEPSLRKRARRRK
jgi:DNA-binding MarR family transcriptional regulator